MRNFYRIGITFGCPFKLVSDDIWVGLFGKKGSYTGGTFGYGGGLSGFHNGVDRGWKWLRLGNCGIGGWEKWGGPFGQGTGFKRGFL